MECIVKRVSATPNSNVIVHADRKKHKYIAKVKRKNGKYRYFYDKLDYQQYLLGKKFSMNNIKKKVSEIFSDSDDSKTKTQQKGKKKSDEILKKHKNTTVGFALFIDKRLITKTISFVKSTISKLDNDSSDEKTEEKKHKYIAKVELPNGKYRYFYKQSEYDAYLKRLEYQKNEPDFMKDVPDISDNKVYTAKEDMDKVNETYDPFDDDTSTNCANCSAAYELRRRGYDVEAKANGTSKDYNGRGDRVFDYFDGATLLGINGDGSTVEYSEKFCRDLWDEKLTEDVAKTKYKDIYDHMMTRQSYTPQTIEKAITANNPPGSRGMIDVQWKMGGGHSIVYEVNTNGSVTIRDSQTYDVYSLDELADSVRLIHIARTDNLQLKEDILDAVVPNKDEKRVYGG